MSDKHRVLITGCQGFIGKALTHTLRMSGFEVWGIDLSGPEKDSHIICTNLLDLEQTKEATATLPSFLTLIHTAALAHGQRPPKDESCITINTRITDNILQAIGQKIQRMIFFSSVAVYGEDKRNEPVYVDAESHPSTDYGKSKVLCEKIILKYNLEHCDILRLAPVYDKKHMNDIRKRVFIPGLPSVKMRLIPPPYYSLCHIDTLTKTVADLLTQSPNGLRIFHIADSDPYNQHDLGSWFPGKSIPFPSNLLRPFYWLTSLLPKKQGYALRCLYWKLFKSNIYDTGDHSGRNKNKLKQ